MALAKNGGLSPIERLSAMNAHQIKICDTRKPKRRKEGSGHTKGKAYSEIRGIVRYGDLQGLNKQETAEIFGKEQVYNWHRSYSDGLPNGSIESDTEDDYTVQIEPQLMAG
ncbi:histidine phosphatase superfamily protein [Tanacetum coccineum]